MSVAENLITWEICMSALYSVEICSVMSKCCVKSDIAKCYRRIHLFKKNKAPCLCVAI